MSAGAGQVLELATFGGLADLLVDPSLPAESRWLTFCHRVMSGLTR